MAKIILGKRPDSFKRVVTFDLPEGGKGSVECLYKYRTRTEFGKFIDTLVESAGLKVKSEEGEKFSMAEFMAHTAGANADYLMAVLNGWNLDVELTRDSAQQFADEYPGGAAAVMEAYRGAVQDGRLGN